MADLHPVVEAAARGDLPAWAVADRARREHMERVSALLREWAEARGEAEADVTRWAAAGYLHDALRSAEPHTLRTVVSGELEGLPDPLLHGPAAARRLHDDGVRDPGLLRAVAYHTLGNEEFDDLGLALYAADFLEPGRDVRNDWRAKLRERMPDELHEVVREILRARVEHLLDHDRPVRPETMAFWNRMSEGEPWARASEV